MKAFGTVILLALLGVGTCPAELRELRPGFNLFTPQQDIQIGREAVPELERQMRLVRNEQVDRYLNALLRKLEQSRYARTLEADGSRAAMFPFQVHAVYDNSINAFSLPGGPIFVNTAAIAAAENEAQVAGVIAHEMSHIVLRHPTNQASKRNLVALPAVLAGALTGNTLLGQLAQAGILFTANSAMLKFSRTDEAEADYNGAEMMADAGYNPKELARFFEHLEERAGPGNGLVEFLSDHPNPGNRVQAVDQELRDLPQRRYVLEETGQFARIHLLVGHLAPADGREQKHIEESRPAPPGDPLRSYSGRSFSLSFPANWEVHMERSPDAATIAPASGLVPGNGGQVSIGFGMRVSYYAPEARDADLERDTDALIRRLEQENGEMRAGRPARMIQVAGQAALLSTLYSRSPVRDQREMDVLLTVARPQGLFSVIFVSPQDQFDSAEQIFEKVVKSIQFD